MNAGSGSSDVASEVDLRGARLRGLAARDADAEGRSRALADMGTDMGTDAAGGVDSAGGVAVISNAASVVGGSGCSKPAISSW
jgi:hypothetical protein